MAQSKSEGEKNNQMELENEKKEPVEAKPEVYILDEDDDDFEEFEIEGNNSFWIKRIIFFKIMKKI